MKRTTIETAAARIEIVEKIRAETNLKINL
jgi:hypothetical protein